VGAPLTENAERAALLRLLPEEYGTHPRTISTQYLRQLAAMYAASRVVTISNFPVGELQPPGLIEAILETDQDFRQASMADCLAMKKAAGETSSRRREAGEVTHFATRSIFRNVPQPFWPELSETMQREGVVELPSDVEEELEDTFPGANLIVVADEDAPKGRPPLAGLYVDDPPEMTIVSGQITALRGSSDAWYGPKTDEYIWAAAFVGRVATRLGLPDLL